MNSAGLRRTFADGCIIAAIGGLLALVANHFNPQGIPLRRDHFPPASPGPPPRTASAAEPPTSRAAQPPASETRLARRGLAVVPLARVVELHRDPRFAEGRIVFIDARDDRHFHAGRIPGAIQLDHYHLDRHAAKVLAACLIAEQIVVYCNGGNCEDSELAAGDLLDFGVPASKILVYAGGIDEWRRQGLPIATGQRTDDRVPPP